MQLNLFGVSAILLHVMDKFVQWQVWIINLVQPTERISNNHIFSSYLGTLGGPWWKSGRKYSAINCKDCHIYLHQSHSVSVKGNCIPTLLCCKITEKDDTPIRQLAVWLAINQFFNLNKCTLSKIGWYHAFW